MLYVKSNRGNFSESESYIIGNVVYVFTMIKVWLSGCNPRLHVETSILRDETYTICQLYDKHARHLSLFNLFTSMYNVQCLELFIFLELNNKFCKIVENIRTASGTNLSWAKVRAHFHGLVLVDPGWPTISAFGTRYGLLLSRGD